MDHLLSLIIFFPLFAGVLGFIVSKDSIKAYGISIATVEFLLSLALWFNYNPNGNNFQFVEYFPLISTYGINYHIGIDGISLFLIILSTFMTMISLIALNIQKDIKNLVVTILVLEMTMVGVFSALDVIVFYLFWELSLVPMLYIIGAWGGKLRIYAAVKFFLYTFAGSLIMLIGILYLANYFHSVTGIWTFSITDWQLLVIPVHLQILLFIAFFIGFAIKVPMFPFHTWLPYAHGQAPTIGSIILAAVLLKMGTYGFVRFSLPLFPDASVYFTPFIATLAIIMIIYTAMVAFAQKDMKQVIAYSSISHMGVIVLGTFALNAEGITGSVFFMLSHGVVSGALFMLVGVIYDRRHTKLMSEFGGLASVMPKYATIFGIILMSSVGLPLTMGFVGEFLSLVGFYKVSPVMTALGGTGIILGAIYMLNLFRESFFGKSKSEENSKLKDLNSKELMALVPLVLVVIWLGVYPKPILTPIDTSVKKMLHLMQLKAQTTDAKERLLVVKKDKEAK